MKDMNLRWVNVLNEDTLALMVGRVELGRLYRSVNGVLAVTIDGSLEQEFSNIEVAKSAVEDDIISGQVVCVERYS